MALPERLPADLTHVDDGTLVARVRARDESAVRELTRRYNRRLYRLARGIVQNDGEAEDVVQATYVRAFTSLAGFRGESSFGTWITRIAMNEALGRRRQRRSAVEWTEDVERRLHASILRFPSSVSVPNDPEHQMAEQQVRELLERSIDALPDAFRMVFIARDVEGMSVEDTAALLRIRPETVKTRTHRARRRLRDEIERRVGPGLAAVFPFDGARCQRLTNAVALRLQVGVIRPV